MKAWLFDYLSEYYSKKTTKSVSKYESVVTYFLFLCIIVL
jgi:hypothetical protein